ncbi:hypothetical protein SAMN05880590_101930 [Rhizobium sp. RU35A]|uniref:glycosyltransferase family 4 protein n=1 Tax=Rhizobium sp. RU35A TaxID=1907414 RepID=UPI00095676CC|nr:glycosyltransferase family 4 protein [Rhizobium sp. RU35A]SIQ03851.1 hypothetical protein SAMN05880590_101930 [Rhizobium sp. RU35A]
MIIGFNADEICERGTSVALLDYALGNEQLLGNRSIVFYNQGARTNVAEAIARFAAQVELVPYADHGNLHRLLLAGQVDALYTIKGGGRDGVDFTDVPTMVHAVFPTWPSEIHGRSYVYVSPWLARFCRGHAGQSVPHIVHAPHLTDDLRAELGLSSEATVFGCYGGAPSFDIDFVKDQVIPQVLDQRQDIHFLFMNITPFIRHPRVFFLPGTTNVDAKTRFIATTDAMLHARKRGETFGLACAEFFAAGRKVITYALSREKAHIDHLGADALLYRNPGELRHILMSFDRTMRADPTAFLAAHTPHAVMAEFREKLIAPALAADSQPLSLSGVPARMANTIYYMRRKGILPTPKAQ